MAVVEPPCCEPSKMPASMISELESPDIKQKILQIGVEVRTSTPQAMAEMQAKDIVAWRASMNSSGHVPE